MNKKTGKYQDLLYMSTLKEIWFYLITKLYFWLFESMNVESIEAEVITHDFIIHGKQYKAISRETKYIMVSVGKIARTKEFSIYQVKMRRLGENAITGGCYPLLVPFHLKEMNFGHTQAVRTHWEKNYKNKHY